MKNLDLPLQSNPSSGNVQFELVSSSDHPHPEITYGLNVRNTTNNNSATNGEATGEKQRTAPVETVLLRSLEEDLKRLPEDRGFEHFENVPVEGFGKALLARYGWVERRGIGKNAKEKEDVKMKEYGNTEGLGYRKLKIREAEDLKQKRDGRRKVSKGNGGGSEKRSETRVNVERAKSINGDRVSWLRNNIRVRVISKSLEGGRLYLKKGVVVDVVGPYLCAISMDESKELIQGVEQELLETALPKHGGPVLVLYGRHKGAYGSLLEKDLDRETGVVRDADSQELLNVKLEQIAEYMGDPSYHGF